MRRLLCLSLLCAAPALAQTTYVRNPPPASSNPVYTTGTAADNSAAASTNVPALPAVVATGQAPTRTNTNRAALVVDADGRTIVRATHKNTFVCNLNAQTSSAACLTDIAQSQGGLSIAAVYVTDVFLSNGSNAGALTVVSGTGTACVTSPVNIVPTTYLPANSGFVWSSGTPYRIAWASTMDICCQIVSGSNPYSCQVRGYYSLE